MTHLLVIAAFVALLLRDASDAPLCAMAPSAAAWATLAPQAALVIAHLLYARRCARRLLRRADARAAGRAEGTASAVRTLAVLWHTAGVLALGWLDAVRAATGDLLGVDELLSVLPPLAVLAATWWNLYPVESFLHGATTLRALETGHPLYPFPPRGRYVLLQCRNHLALFVLPITLILILNEALVMAASRWARTGAPYTADLLAAAQVVASLGVLVVTPVLIVRVWRTTPLGPGPLRDALADLARRCRASARNLLVWDTGGTMANAAVLGFVPGLRYILLTDALLDTLPDPHLRAVMAHELGHVRKHHMFWLAAVLAASVLGGSLLFTPAVDALLAGTTEGAMLPALAALVPTLGFALAVFGYVSRRFEWQADAFAAAQLSPADRPRPVITPDAARTVIHALDAVAYLNHIPRQRATWRHGSIAQRQARIASLVGTPLDALPIDATVTALKAVAVSGLALTVWAMFQ